VFRDELNALQPHNFMSATLKSAYGGCKLLRRAQLSHSRLGGSRTDITNCTTLCRQWEIWVDPKAQKKLAGFYEGTADKLRAQAFHPILMASAW